MNTHELGALRDFAIEHLPIAQRQLEQAKRFNSDQESYYRRLFIASNHAMASATSTAVELLAAQLLDQLMLLALSEGYEGIEDTIIEKARHLCRLTNTTIQWLPDQIPVSNESTSQESTSKQVSKATLAPPPSAPHEVQATLQPGTYVDTNTAAKALGYKSQTLRKWVSQESGPIQPPSSINGRHRWSADEILKLLAKRTK